MMFRIIRLAPGGFLVKDEFHDNVFASTRVDESLMFIRDKMMAPFLTQGASQ